MALRQVLIHYKFEHLKFLLGCNKALALGYLECIWHFTAHFAPRGDIGRCSDKQIELWCEWTGEEGGLIAALVESGWLDPHPEYRLVTHGWAEYCDDTVRKRLNRSGEELIQQNITPSDDLEPCLEQGEPCPDNGGQRRTMSGQRRTTADYVRTTADNGELCPDNGGLCLDNGGTCPDNGGPLPAEIRRNPPKSALPETGNRKPETRVLTPPPLSSTNPDAVKPAHGGEEVNQVEKYIRQKLPGLTQNQIAEVLLMVDQGRASKVGLEELIREVDRNNPRSREALFVALLRKPGGGERASPPPPPEPQPEPEIPECLEPVANWQDLTWELMEAAERKLPSLPSAKAEMAQVCQQMEIFGRTNGTIYAHAPPMIAAFRRLMEERGVVFVRLGSVAAATSEGG